MKLPYAAHAYVDIQKITHDLLSDENSMGKANFFEAYGYTLESTEPLRTTLLEHARIHDVAQTVLTPYGVKYIIEGGVIAVDGRIMHLRTVWILEDDSSSPRFITAYPARSSR